MGKSVSVRSYLPVPVFISAGILFLLALIVPLPWVSWGSEVDIHSGRVRESTWVLGFLVKRKRHETWISLHADPIGEPAWRYVATNAWWGDGHPHWRYHDAVKQIQEVERISKGLGWDNDAWQAAADEMLRRLQSGDESEASDFVEQIEVRRNQEMPQSAE